MNRSRLTLSSLTALIAVSCGQPGPLYLPDEKPPRTEPEQNLQTLPDTTETGTDQTPEAPPVQYEPQPAIETSPNQ